MSERDDERRKTEEARRARGEVQNNVAVIFHLPDDIPEEEARRIYDAVRRFAMDTTDLSVREAIMSGAMIMVAATLCEGHQIEQKVAYLHRMINDLVSHAEAREMSRPS